jgi:hypothetical protein
VVSPDILTEGDAFTVTVTVSRTGHLPAFTVKTYWVVTVGDADGLIMLGSFNPVDGCHLYVVPLVAVVVSTMLLPLQIAVSGMEAMVATGSTSTKMLSLAVHCLSVVTTTVYCVLAVGEAKGLATVGSLNPAAGSHL